MLLNYLPMLGGRDGRGCYITVHRHYCFSICLVDYLLHRHITFVRSSTFSSSYTARQVVSFAPGWRAGGLLRRWWGYFLLFFLISLFLSLVPAALK